MTTDPSTAVHVIIVAAGIGRRFAPEQANQLPKQYKSIGKLPMLAHSILAFEDVNITDITVVLHPDDDHWNKIQPLTTRHKVLTTSGGSQRHDSVRNGIKSLQANPQDWVLVHDAARPCVATTEINDLINSCIEQQQGGLLVKPITDTIKLSSDGFEVQKTVDRKNLFAALTPQMFRCGDMLKALTVFEADSITDEASAMEAQGHKPLMVRGLATNLKVTHSEDIPLAEMILQQQGRL